MARTRPLPWCLRRRLYPSTHCLHLSTLVTPYLYTAVLRKPSQTLCFQTEEGLRWNSFCLSTCAIRVKEGYAIPIRCLSMLLVSPDVRSGATETNLSVIYLHFVVHSQFSSPLSTPRRGISFDENCSHMSNNHFPIKRAPRCQLLHVFPRRRLRFRLECRAKSFQHRSDKRNAHMGLSSTFFGLSP